MNASNSQQPAGLNRRDFGKAVFSGALAGAALPLSAVTTPAQTLRPIPPGIKLSYSAGGQAARPTEQNMAYLKDLDIAWLNLNPWTELVNPAEGTAERFTQLREQWEAGGFKVYNIGSALGPSGSLHNMPEVTLNLPGREKKIEEYLNYLRYIGKAGIPYTTYAHMGNGIWRSGHPTVRGGARTMEFDEAAPDKYCASFCYPPALTAGRKFTVEEIWDNYTYFIKKVVPVAEEARVRIGIHLDDPPVPVLEGVPRIFINFENYKRALAIANSPNIGLCMCCGNVLSAGKNWGKDFVETIHYFGRRRQIFKIHVQAVTAPLPHFTETFVDDCYYDYYKVIKALRQVDYDGAVMPAHIPISTAGPRIAEAYTMGYMQALIKRANEEA